MPAVRAVAEPVAQGIIQGGAAHLTGGARALSAEELREEVVRLGPWHVEVDITPEVSTAAFLDAPAESR